MIRTQAAVFEQLRADPKRAARAADLGAQYDGLTRGPVWRPLEMILLTPGLRSFA
ncbi:MAG TPA: hypothetical protein VI094_04505 [Propionibacteriaceae bacterium]